MSRKISALSFIPLLFLILISCNDIIEPDLSKQTVVLISPSDGVVSSVRNQTFIWEKIKEAKEYRIQIASPNFNQIQSLLLDSLVESTKHSVNLFPGTYQWRVRAENVNSWSPYTTFSITIDSTSNMANITVILLSPADSVKTSLATHNFTWRPESKATKYVFQISGGSYYNSVITTNSYYNNFSFSSLADGWYKWGVQAQNDFSLSPFSYRNILLDRVAPPAPTLQLPAHNSFIHDNLPVTFTWARASDGGSKIVDSIYIYTDSLWNNLVYSAKSLTRTCTVDSTKLSAGPHFWFVKAVDEAGNNTVSANYFKFTLY